MLHIKNWLTCSSIFRNCSVIQSKMTVISITSSITWDKDVRFVIYFLLNVRKIRWNCLLIRRISVWFLFLDFIQPTIFSYVTSCIRNRYLRWLAIWYNTTRFALQTIKSETILLLDFATLLYGKWWTSAGEVGQVALGGAQPSQSLTSLTQHWTHHHPLHSWDLTWNCVRSVYGTKLNTSRTIRSLPPVSTCTSCIQGSASVSGL